MDIEDTGELLEDVISSKNNNKQQQHQLNKNKKVNTSKIQKKTKKEEEEKNSKSNENKKKIFVKTFGCSHNASDSEYMIGILSQEGYEIVDNLEDSDLTIINSCTVKSPSQAAFLNSVLKSKEHNKHVVVGGVYPRPKEI